MQKIEYAKINTFGNYYGGNRNILCLLCAVWEITNESLWKILIIFIIS